MSRRLRLFAPSDHLVPGAVLAFVCLFAGATVGLLGATGASSKVVIAAALALPLGAMAGAWALLRFNSLLLIAVVSRISLDALKTGPLEPATALGVIFVFGALARLLARDKAGTLQAPSKLTRALFGLVAAGFASALFADDRAAVLLACVKLLAGVLMFAVLEQELREDGRLALSLQRAVLASAAVPFVVAAYQFVTNSGNHDTLGFNRLHGTAVHPTPFASYLSLLIIGLLPSVMMNKRRRLLAPLVAAAPALVFLTYTRSAWIAIAVGVAYVVFHVRRKLLVPLAVAGVAFVVLTPSVHARLQDLRTPAATPYGSNSLNWRLDYWSDLLQFGRGNHLTGIGLDATPRVSAETGRQGLAPHNVFVQSYVEMGVVGLGALCAVVACFALQVRRQRKMARDHEQWLAAVAFGGVGVVLLVQGLTSNILTQTMLHWYAAAACLYGFARADARSAVAQDAPSTSMAGEPFDAASYTPSVSSAIRSQP